MAVKVQEIPQVNIEDSEDEAAKEVASLTAEINLMQKLSHPNIVKYFGCQSMQTTSGQLRFEIFLEHCHGGTLTSLRKRFGKRLNMSLARTYTKQILEGLKYLHGQGVLHRDLKSDNVLISANGVAKLADFGCSKKIGTSTSSTQGKLSNTLVGTPLFMAPEVVNDCGPGYSRPADIWSLGCIVIEMLGRKPWAFPAGGNVFQMMFQIAQSDGLPPGVPNPCPPVLRNFFECCFERDPSKRKTATELLHHPWITCPESTLEDVSDP
jgi:serine/threonine protein kinase